MQTKGLLQADNAGNEIDETSNEKRVLTPEAKVRKLLYQLMVEVGWSQVTNDEKQYLVKSVKLQEIRLLIAEFFAGFS